VEDGGWTACCGERRL
jgi:hypothetical protein